MEIIDNRRALHQIPELDRNLPKTLAYLERALLGLGCAVFSPMEGSLCTYFDFGADTAIAFRSDADALPIPEKPGCLSPPGIRGKATPAVTTATWRSCWSWPAA